MRSLRAAGREEAVKAFERRVRGSLIAYARDVDFALRDLRKAFDIQGPLEAPDVPPVMLRVVGERRY